MRSLTWLSLGGIVVLAACAEAPVQTAAPTVPTARRAPDEPTATAIAQHREQAVRNAKAGDHAGAAREWHIVAMLAPGDDAVRKEEEVERAAIRQGVRDNLQAGSAAARAGDADRATQAMLRVLALDPENAEAARMLRELDRQKLTRIQNNQSLRAARENPTTTAVGSRAVPAPVPAAAQETGDSYDIEQPIEMFKAGDISGGLRDFHAFVDANPRNDRARLRIATIVYDAGVEAEQKGAREQALMLVDQAQNLRGKPVPHWTARAHALQKALSSDYYERGVALYKTDARGAVKLWEASVKYDPQNRQAQAKLQEARGGLDKSKRVEKAN